MSYKYSGTHIRCILLLYQLKSLNYLFERDKLKEISFHSFSEKPQIPKNKQNPSICRFKTESKLSHVCSRPGDTQSENFTLKSCVRGKQQLKKNKLKLKPKPKREPNPTSSANKFARFDCLFCVFVAEFQGQRLLEIGSIIIQREHLSAPNLFLREMRDGTCGESTCQPASTRVALRWQLNDYKLNALCN